MNFSGQKTTNVLFKRLRIWKKTFRLLWKSTNESYKPSWPSSLHFHSSHSQSLTGPITWLMYNSSSSMLSFRQLIETMFSRSCRVGVRMLRSMSWSSNGHQRYLNAWSLTLNYALIRRSLMSHWPLFSSKTAKDASLLSSALSLMASNRRSSKKWTRSTKIRSR